MTPLQDDILRLMRFCPWTAYELADELRISEQYARRTMFELYEMGVVREIGSRRHGTGRPRKVWEIAA